MQSESNRMFGFYTELFNDPSPALCIKATISKRSLRFSVTVNILHELTNHYKGLVFFLVYIDLTFFDLRERILHGSYYKTRLYD